MEDIIIRGGTVVDGTGSPRFEADVAVKDGVITVVGDCSGLDATEVLNAKGLTVTPGFIDAHAHSDTAFLHDDSSASKLYQGITLEVSGNCGSSPFPAPKEQFEPDPWQCASFKDYLEKVKQEDHRMGINQLMLVGHGSLRESVVGEADRPASKAEMDEMKRLLRRELETGAWGLSLGLEYAPGCFADVNELTELARVVKEYDGIVTCHMRSEGLQIDDAIRELLDVGRGSGVHVHVSHLKLDNPKVHGRAPEIWEYLEEARREGINVTADVYPFTASSTSLTVRCPKWSLDGGREALLAFLNGPRRQEIVEQIRSRYNTPEQANTCIFSDDEGLWPEIVGKTLREVAENILGTTDYAEAAAEILVRTQAKVSCIFFVMSERDMLYFLSRDVSVASDSAGMSGNPEKVKLRPHPRAYGAMAEYMRLVRENRLCTLEEAVCRVTGKTAERFGLKNRGILAAGKAADITVFDPMRIMPRTTYLEPIQLAVGVRHVVINGGIAMRDGVQTKHRGGHFLLRGQA